MQLYPQPLTARPPPVHLASSPRLLQPRGARVSLSPQLQGHCHLPQGEDTGLGPQGTRGERGTPCTHSPHCPVPLQSPLRGATPRPLGAASGSADTAWAPSLQAHGSGMGGAAEECEIGARSVCIRSGGSAGVKGSLLWGCVPVMGHTARGSCSLATSRGCSDGTPCSFLKPSGGSGTKG